MANVVFKLDGVGAIQSGSWGIIKGANPYITGLTYDVAAGIFPKNEMTLEMGGPSDTLKIKGVYRVEDQEVSPGIRRVVVADRRWLWQFKTIDGFYNLRRKSGQFVRYEDYKNFRDAGYAELRFRTFSLNPGDLSSSAGGAEIRKPWTALEIIEDILINKLGIKKADVRRDKGVKDNGYVPEEFRLIGINASNALEQLFPLANVNIYISLDSKIYIYDPYTDQSRFSSAGRRDGALNLTGQWIKPSKVKVKFIKERERSFSNFDTTYKLENVIQLPYDITIPEQILPDGTKAANVVYKRGEYCNLKDALSAIHKDGELFYLEAVKKRCRPQLLNTLFFESLAERNTGTGTPLVKTEKDLQMAPWLSAFKRDIFKLWRIPTITVNGATSFSADQSLEIRAETGDVQNPLTNQRLPSPVFADWCEVLKRVALNANGSFKYGGEKGVNYRFNSEEPAPLLLTVVDPDLAIFRIDFGFDISQMSETRYIGTFVDNQNVNERPPKWEDDSNPDDWSNTILRPTPFVSFIISVVDGTDFFHEVEVPLKLPTQGQKESKLTLEIVSLKTKAYFAAGSPTPVDPELLQEIANLEARNAEIKLKDYVYGTVKTEFTKEHEKLLGKMQSIIWTVSANDAFTIYDFSKVPPEKNQWEKLSPWAQAVMFKNLDAFQRS